MSLNLRISRTRPRRSRGRLFWLVLGIVAAATWIAWHQGWQPQLVLAQLSQNVAPQVSQTIVQLNNNLQASPGAATSSETVMMVSSAVIENPQSQAYTAELYQATGQDPIPWPNIAGRTKVQSYVIEPGDSLWSIAAKFELDLDTLRWSNPELELKPDVLSVGDELRILPVQGAYHLASAGETIAAIAEQYGVAPDDIVDYPPNALYPPVELQPGQGLIIPFGRKGVTLPKPALSLESALAWPVVGAVGGGFTADHPALDLSAPYGATVYAAEGGTITYAGWGQEGYGFTVVIDHGGGRETWYNHLKGALLPAGNEVSRGTPIGEVGSTGHIDGPHLHFELRLNDQPVDPMIYLPGDTPQ